MDIKSLAGQCKKTREKLQLEEAFKSNRFSLGREKMISELVNNFSPEFSSEADERLKILLLASLLVESYRIGVCENLITPNSKSVKIPATIREKLEGMTGANMAMVCGYLSPIVDLKGKSKNFMRRIIFLGEMHFCFNGVEEYEANSKSHPFFSEALAEEVLKRISRVLSDSKESLSPSYFDSLLQRFSQII